MPKRWNAVLSRALTIALFAAAFAPLARAQYPERQITMVVCFPAGGGTDIAARIINTPLGEALGKPVIIENRGGAGGNIATTAVARMAADGYTLLVCSSAFVVNPEPLRVGNLRSAQGLRAADGDRRLAQRVRGAGAIADQVDEGIPREGQGGRRQDELDQLRASAPRRSSPAS